MRNLRDFATRATRALLISDGVISHIESKGARSLFKHGRQIYRLLEITGARAARVVRAARVRDSHISGNARSTYIRTRYISGAGNYRRETCALNMGECQIFLRRKEMGASSMYNRTPNISPLECAGAAARVCDTGTFCARRPNIPPRESTGDRVARLGGNLHSHSEYLPAL